jgi:phosphopantothenoylcysteine decarboxylase/phosphopantothenate--cysteine ligase
MGARRKRQVLVGFALEVQDARENAINKIKTKNLDYVVLNSPDSFAGDLISCEILDREGEGTSYDGVTKRKLAREIVRLLEKAHRGTP